VTDSSVVRGIFHSVTGTLNVVVVRSVVLRMVGVTVSKVSDLMDIVHIFFAWFHTRPGTHLPLTILPLTHLLNSTSLPGTG